MSLTDWQDNQLTILIALPISWSLSLATVMISTVKTTQSSHCLPAVLATVVFRLLAIILAFTYLNMWTFLILAALVVVNGCYQLLECSHATSSETMLRHISFFKQSTVHVTQHLKKESIFVIFKPPKRV